MTLLDFWTTLSLNGIVLSKEQMETLERYAKELVYWNEKVNLISRKDEDNVYDRHILHSLCLMKFVEFKPKSWVLDIGTGGGLPGLPIRIANEDVRMVMVDSIAKKIKMTAMFANHTGLKNLEVLNIRTEELSLNKNYQKKFDFIISRAVAKIEHLVEWSLPMLKTNGTFAFLKGGDLTDEILWAKKKYPKLEIIEHKIKLNNFDYFTEEDKKVVICKFLN